MTHLYPFEIEYVTLERFTRPGGAIESIFEGSLVATPEGRFVLVFRDGTVEYLEGNVPMNEAALKAHPIGNNPEYLLSNFRVVDILLKEIENGYELFVTHHYFTGECIRFRLSSTTLLAEEESLTVSPNWRTIFDANPCIPHIEAAQTGGKMLTDGENHLLVTIGDHGGYEGWYEKDFLIAPDDHLGKLVRIAIETGEVETLAIGFRNSQGLARDADGNIWVPDHGPQGGDELNLLERGGNYGWPVVSYGVQYGSEIPPIIEEEKVGRHDGFIRPVFSWVPSPAISAIAVNDEEQLPLWKDDLLVASLVDGALFRVRRHGTDVQYVEKIELGYRIRDIAIMPDGRIALLRDRGRIYFLSHSLRYCNEEARKQRNVYSIDCESIAASPAPDSDTAAGARLFGLHCGSCHDLNSERHGSGPHLVGIVGRTAGEVGGFNFSDTLRSSDVVWTRDSITQFLTNQQRFAPGTSMPSSGITEEEARVIADYLAGATTMMPDDTLHKFVGDSQPAIRSYFNVYLIENALTYAKRQCAAADTAPTFFLHIEPIDVEDLLDDRKRHGFNNLDFIFDHNGKLIDGDCAVTIPLPDYDIAAIRTGQFVQVDGGFEHLWEGEIRLDAAE